MTRLPVGDVLRICIEREREDNTGWREDMNIIFEWFQQEKVIFISSSYRVMFFVLYGQKSKQANREHVNSAGKHTCF